MDDGEGKGDNVQEKSLDKVRGMCPQSQDIRDSKPGSLFGCRTARKQKEKCD